MNQKNYPAHYYGHFLDYFMPVSDRSWFCNKPFAKKMGSFNNLQHQVRFTIPACENTVSRKTLTSVMQ